MPPHSHRQASPSEILFFVDGDVTLFADPRPHFLALNVDMALMSDFKDPRACTEGSTRQLLAKSNATSVNFNSGFFLTRSVTATRELWTSMLMYHRSNPGIRQQVALNSLLQKNDECDATMRRLHSRRLCAASGARRPAYRVRFAALNEGLFLNGYCFSLSSRAIYAESNKPSSILLLL